ncbi:hypothetical protein FBU30_010602 [Linnemannia zychae]|nr:hypothetical protein FBU30_010602 [Linnemannia zychae]
MPDPIKTIELSQNQITALAIVSKNDYQSNTHIMDAATNYSIIMMTDVTNLLASDPSQVAVLSLNLGVSCLLGATISFPPGQNPATLKCHLSEENQRKSKQQRQTEPW